MCVYVCKWPKNLQHMLLNFFLYLTFSAWYFLSCLTSLACLPLPMRIPNKRDFSSFLLLFFIQYVLYKNACLFHAQAQPGEVLNILTYNTAVCYWPRSISLYSRLVSLWNRLLLLYCFLPSCFHFTCNPRVNAFLPFLLLCIKQILCGLSNTICCFVLLYQNYICWSVSGGILKKDENGLSRSLDDILCSPGHLTWWKWKGKCRNAWKNIWVK